MVVVRLTAEHRRRDHHDDHDTDGECELAPRDLHV